MVKESVPSALTSLRITLLLTLARAISEQNERGLKKKKLKGRVNVPVETKEQKDYY